MQAKNLIQYAVINGKVNKPALCKMIEQMPSEEQERFTNAILGIVDLEDIERKITRFREYFHDDKNCNFVRYNYLYDCVTYICDVQDHRYFKSSEEAREYNKTGSNRQDGLEHADLERGYQYFGSHTFMREKVVSLEEWENDS